MQGFPHMMKAEDYVVSNHLAQVISQSFASAEDAFNGAASLESALRVQERGYQRRHCSRVVG